MHIRCAICNIIAIVLFTGLCRGCCNGPVAIFDTPKGEIRVCLRIAKTEKERQKGLMFQTHLGRKEGMLFLFDNDQIQSFWMKNTYLSLDLVFMDDKRLIVDVLEDLPPCPSESCPVYYSRVPARYVLELKGGFIRQFNVQKGSVVRIISF
jgi:uncharacterized membrane protein (UPF0127 family)